MMKLSEKMDSLGTETAYKVSFETKEFAAKNNTVYNLHIGDIDVDTPKPIVDSCIQALQNGKTGYPPSNGILELRETIAEVCGGERGVNYTSNNVCVQPGGKPIIMKFLLTTTNPGDEVLYPTPGYPIYESLINFLELKGKPYKVDLQESGEIGINVNEIKEMITENTKAIFINNYHNPTGMALLDEEMEELAQMCNDHNLFVLSDEAYFHFYYEDSEPKSIIKCPGMKERTVVLITSSKTFSMTGWRIGAALGPEYIINKFNQLTTNDEACTCHFVQYAYITALTNEDVKTETNKMIAEFKERRDVLHELINEIPGFFAPLPPSSFYIWINATKAMKILNVSSYVELRTKLLHNTGVSFCTRNHFGSPLEDETEFWIRFAYSSISIEDIKLAMKSLSDYMNQNVN
eukprot:TRINITY_DN2539_c0_g1_i1.p1 TRINITY_DN2539_c0_g1~~TRINITY_DN2539_c0_g1_i1.p1  ORF type:complete len:406 (-),score=134.59 TRINITY_DN2539_c0_g1_i1:124-1341(-)